MKYQVPGTIHIINKQVIILEDNDTVYRYYQDLELEVARHLVTLVKAADMWIDTNCWLTGPDNEYTTMQRKLDREYILMHKPSGRHMDVSKLESISTGKRAFHVRKGYLRAHKETIVAVSPTLVNKQNIFTTIPCRDNIIAWLDDHKDTISKLNNVTMQSFGSLMASEGIYITTEDMNII